MNEVDASLAYTVIKVSILKKFSADYRQTVEIRSFSRNKICRAAVWWNKRTMYNKENAVYKNKTDPYPLAHHWCLSDRPFHSGSVRTILSMSFFHSMPSEMTRCHSRHTSSAAHRERASRNDKMFSAMCSRPRAEEANTAEQTGLWLFYKFFQKMKDHIIAGKMSFYVHSKI